jgi:hypothetical protein
LTLHVVRGGYQVFQFQHIFPISILLKERVEELRTSIGQLWVERYPHEGDEVCTATFNLVDTLRWLDASFYPQRYRDLGWSQRQFAADVITERPQREWFKQSSYRCQVHRGCQLKVKVVLTIQTDWIPEFDEEQLSVIVAVIGIWQEAPTFTLTARTEHEPVLEEL